MNNDMERECILLDQRDNTATALVDLEPGCTIRLSAAEEGALAGTAKVAVEEIVICDRIPYAHKFARRPIRKGEDVRKYGEVIGAATADIEAGAHVHVHNIRGKRA